MVVFWMLWSSKCPSSLSVWSAALWLLLNHCCALGIKGNPPLDSRWSIYKQVILKQALSCLYAMCLRGELRLVQIVGQESVADC